MRDVTCHLCGSDRFSLISAREKFGMELRTVQCESCGLIYTNPQPDEEDLVKLYQGDVTEDEWSQGYLEIQNSNARELRRRFRDRLAALAREGITGGRLLDVGSQLGYFLDEAKKAGFDADTGIELGRVTAQWARDNFGQTIHECLLEDAPLEPHSFDVITAFHVFEHVPDPARFLERCKELLSPGGVVVIEVPNRESRRFREAYDGGYVEEILRPEKHLCEWGPRQLADRFKASGLQRVRTLTFEDVRAGRSVENSIPVPGASGIVRKVGKAMPFLRGPYAKLKKALRPGAENLMAIGRTAAMA